MSGFTKQIFDSLEDASLIRQTLEDIMDSAGIVDPANLAPSSAPSKVLYKLAVSYISVYNALVSSKEIPSITNNKTIH